MNIQMNRVLLNAAARDNRLVLEQALNSQHGGVTPDDVHRALLKACTHGNIKCVSRLLDETGIDIDYGDEEDGNTALMLACSNIQLGVVELLISSGCDLNKQSDRGRCALHMAVWNNGPEIVACLLAFDAYTHLQDCYGDTPVMLCARKGYPNVLEQLLRVGSDVSFESTEKETALHYAARNGHYDCLRLLVEHTSQLLETRTMWSYTPLLVATMSAHNRCAEMLIIVGSDIEACDRSGQSVLHHAAANDMANCLTILLDRGADPDIKDEEGNTPLVLALKKKSIDSASVLIQNGCDVNIMGRCTIQRRYSWYPAVLIAYHCGTFQLVQMLVLAGCNIEPLRTLLTSDPDALIITNQHPSMLDWLLEICHACPPRLTECCKSVIRSCLGRQIPEKADALPLPPSMKGFLISIEFDDRTAPSQG